MVLEKTRSKNVKKYEKKMKHKKRNISKQWPRGCRAKTVGEKKEKEAKGRTNNWENRDGRRRRRRIME